MKRQTPSVFLYRVVERTKRGKQKEYIAEVQADCDDNARRKIIHAAMHEGGSVQVIMAHTGDDYYPDNSPKRKYHD
jgi:hypothetical protein